MPDLVEPVLESGAISRHGQPTLEVDELTVRPWLAADAGALQAAYTDPDIQRWHCRWLTADESRAWIAGREQHWRDELGADWAVMGDGKLLGRVGLRTLDRVEGHAEIAYWVVPAARGRGVAPRAVGAMCRWLFDAGLHRLTLTHSVHNTGSCRVAAKLRFELEGTMRRQLRHADGWHDMHLHARLASD